MTAKRWTAKPRYKVGTMVHVFSQNGKRLATSKITKVQKDVVNRIYWYYTSYEPTVGRSYVYIRKAK